MTVKIKDAELSPTADGESARILDEMDRLLGEMQDTMKVIKRMLEVETESEPGLAGDKFSLNEVVHSS